LRKYQGLQYTNADFDGFMLRLRALLARKTHS
jgi:hypothetical protein